MRMQHSGSAAIATGLMPGALLLSLDKAARLMSGLACHAGETATLLRALDMDECLPPGLAAGLGGANGAR